VVVGLGVWWRKFGLDGTNVNELTHQRLTDIGRAPSFYDCLVEVAPLTPAAARRLLFVAGARSDRHAPGCGWPRPAWAAAAARWATTARRSAATSTCVPRAAGGRLAGRRRTPAALRSRLELSQRMRDFAVTELKLPDNRSYRRYADLQRSAAVWNVVAAPELSLTLKTWCFPVMGCVGYRGYFEPRAGRCAGRASCAARAGGQRLRRAGLLDAGLDQLARRRPAAQHLHQWPEGELARLIFHELAHQVAYANDDTDLQRVVRHRGRAPRRRSAGWPRAPARRARSTPRSTPPQRLPRADAAPPRSAAGLYDSPRDDEAKRRARPS
jgi:predicted aminopeptidase